MSPPYYFSNSYCNPNSKGPYRIWSRHSFNDNSCFGRVFSRTAGCTTHSSHAGHVTSSTLGAERDKKTCLKYVSKLWDMAEIQQALLSDFSLLVEFLIGKVPKIA